MNADDSVLLAAVRAINDLTKRWMQTFGAGADVVGSGLGAWVVLATLLIGARGSTRKELEVALGLAQDDAPAALEAVAALFDGDESIRLAAGLWTQSTVEVLESFLELTDFATIGEMPPKSLLDAWISEHTAGLIDSFPLSPSDSTQLLMASAVVIDVEWQRRFTPKSEFWNGSTDVPIVKLNATSPDLNRAALVSSGDALVGRYRCSSTSSVDVHLVGGHTSNDPSQVLSAAIDALHDPSVVREGASLAVGEGAGPLSVGEASGTADKLRVSVPAFTMRQSHELLENPGLWGLGAASDAVTADFAGMASGPLVVDEAAQDAMVEFTAEGFKAAAATVVRMPRSRRPDEPGRCKVVALDFDEPFGLLAVHRATQLVLFSGWVGTIDALQRSEPGNVAAARRLRP